MSVYGPGAMGRLEQTLAEDARMLGQGARVRVTIILPGRVPADDLLIDEGAVVLNATPHRNDLYTAISVAASRACDLAEGVRR